MSSNPPPPRQSGQDAVVPRAYSAVAVVQVGCLLEMINSVQTGPELEAALASLDKDGYNTAGHLQHAGWTRSCTFFSIRSSVSAIVN